MVHLFHRTLAGGIKQTNRINFIIKKFQPQRIFIIDRINIKNTAPHRKLSRPVYLLCIFITEGHQMRFQLLLLHLLSYLQRQQPLAEVPPREQLFTNPLNRCHHNKTLLPFQHQLTQYLQALLLQLAALRHNFIGDHLQRRKIQHLITWQQVHKIFPQFFRPFLRITQHQHIALRPLLRQRSSHQHTLSFIQTIYYRLSARKQTIPHFAHFRLLPQEIQKLCLLRFHLKPSLPITS